MNKGQHFLQHFGSEIIGGLEKEGQSNKDKKGTYQQSKKSVKIYLVVFWRIGPKSIGGDFFIDFDQATKICFVNSKTVMFFISSPRKNFSLFIVEIFKNITQPFSFSTKSKLD